MALPSDTDPRIERILIEGFRRMSAAEKMERVRAMTRAIHELALVDIRRRHPGEGEREQALRLASRRLDADTMRRVFGWDPDQRGY